MVRVVVLAAPLTWRCCKIICWKKQNATAWHMRNMAATDLVCSSGAIRQLLAAGLALAWMLSRYSRAKPEKRHEVIFYEAIWQLVRDQEPCFVTHRHYFRSGNRKRCWVICIDQNNSCGAYAACAYAACRCDICKEECTQQKPATQARRRCNSGNVAAAQ